MPPVLRHRFSSFSSDQLTSRLPLTYVPWSKLRSRPRRCCWAIVVISSTSNTCPLHIKPQLIPSEPSPSTKAVLASLAEPAGNLASCARDPAEVLSLVIHPSVIHLDLHKTPATRSHICAGPPCPSHGNLDQHVGFGSTTAPDPLRTQPRGTTIQAAENQCCLFNMP